jgi:HD-like signal output (HDOD) protein
MKVAVMRALDNDDASGLLAILQADPLTTARYLSVVNSPFYGSRQVGSAVAAMQLLGCRASAMIALVSSFDYGLSRKRDHHLESVRLHCLQTAVLAHALSAGRDWADDAFVAGLLHEIDFMLHAVNESDSGRKDDDTVAIADRSAALLRSWNLPRGIVDAIAEHGRAQQTGLIPAGGLGRVLWLAHELAHRVCNTADRGQHDLDWFAAQLGTSPGILEQTIAAA